MACQSESQKRGHAIRAVEAAVRGGGWVKVRQKKLNAATHGNKVIEGLIAPISGPIGAYRASIAYGWIGQRSGSGFSDIAGPTLGVFASLDRL
jgi:hypothetical protein